LTNGHSLPIEQDHPNLPPDSPHTESDLSEPDPQVIEGITLDPETGPVSDHDDRDAMDMSESDEEEDAEGEDDADFDMRSPSPDDQDDLPADNSSHSSTQLGKRKASVDDDEHMLQNPELYGLRRSVRLLDVSTRPFADMS